MITRINLRKAERTNPIEKADPSGLIKWGEKNLYPQWLIGLTEDNPIHGGIIEQKCKFIYGSGIELIGDNGSMMKNSVSPYTLDELLEPIIRDAEIFNGYSVLLKKDNFGVWYALPIDFELVRRTEEGIFYEISDDWSAGQQSPEVTNWRTVKCFYKREGDEDELLLYNIQKPKQRLLKEKGKQKVSLGYYPSPTYSGGLTAIQAGLEMDWFTYAEAVNGLKGGTIVNLSNGMPDSQTDAEDKAKKIKGDATDEENQGGVIVTFSDGKENAVEVHQLNGNDLDKRYIEQNKEVAKKIMIAHQVISPSLFGVMNESMFGSKEELETAYILFSEHYVKNRQKFVLQPLIYALNTLNGTTVQAAFKPYLINLEQQSQSGSVIAVALNKQSPLVATKLLQSMTLNEIRSIAGLASIPNGDTVQQSTFSSDEDPVFVALSKCGVERSAVKIERSESYDFSRTDEEFIAQHKTFAVDLNKDQEAIVQMIQDGKRYNEIASELNIKGIELSKKLVELGKLGVLDGWEVKQEVIARPEFKVLYSYEVKAGLGSAVIPTTRDFCRRLVELDRLYTRQEIDTISASVDRDVWRYRGGWYHNPKTDTTTPSCRHEWKQNIVKA